MSLSQGVQLAIAALAQSSAPGSPAGATGPREVPLAQLEVALLQRDRPRRTFRRIGPDRLRELADG
jgi:proteasome alpha subunit